MKKIIPYLFIFIILLGVGFFGLTGKVNAEEVRGVCKTQNVVTKVFTNWERKTSDECSPIGSTSISLGNQKIISWEPYKTGETPPIGGSPTETEYDRCVKTNPDNTNVCKGQDGDPADNKGTQSDFERALKDDCGITSGTKVIGCVLVVFYYTYFQIPALILVISAKFFNAFVNIALDSSLTASSKYIPEAWAVVRDLSNIFFILILLYIAIKIILDLGGHEAKQMIAKVIIMALLINFSMFFAKIVIDSANIIALIFYNKLETVTIEVGQAKPREYTQARPNEKDLSGSMVNAFNPTKLVTGEFLDSTKTTVIFGKTTVSETVPISIKLGMIIISGTIMLFAAYTFFIAGMMFLGRLIELWILIIFSPFAFMSFVIPKMASIPYIGWDEWSKKLVATSFMAPIFMFFMYLIFKLIKANIFGSFVSGAEFPINLLVILIPALIILALLLKATEFAKKGGGQFGEMIMTGAKIVGGLALGAATGGAAMVGTKVIGGAGGALANKLADKAEKAGFGRVGGKLRDVSDFARKSSFDVKGIKIAGKSLGSVTGMNVGEARKGGWSDMKKQQVEKRQKRADELEKRGTRAEKQAVDNAEIELKDKTLQIIDPAILTPEFKELGGLTAKAAMEVIDKKMDKARIDLNDAKNAGDIGAITKAKGELDAAKTLKDDIRNTKIKNTDGTSSSIKDVEGDLRKQKDKLLLESERISKEYAEKISGGLSKGLNMFFRAGAYSMAGADEAARKIRSGTKLDSGEKPH